MMGMGQAIGGVTDLAGKAMGAVGGAIKGVTGMIGGMIGGGKRRREQRAAQKEFDINKARYENLDTSNLAAGIYYCKAISSSVEQVRKIVLVE